MASSPKTDYYNLLDLAPDATPKQVRTAYRQRVTACHPDKFQDPDQKLRAEEAIKQLNLAYETLRDTSLRAAYDRRRAYQNQPHPSTRRPVYPRNTTHAVEKPYKCQGRRSGCRRSRYNASPSVTPLDQAYSSFSSPVAVDPGQLHYEFSAHQGDHLEVFLEQRANVILLDESNYIRYREALDFSYLGGLTRFSPTVLPIPFSGNWHLVIDSAGDSDVLRASARLITSRP